MLARLVVSSEAMWHLLSEIGAPSKADWNGPPLGPLFEAERRYSSNGYGQQPFTSLVATLDTLPRHKFQPLKRLYHGLLLPTMRVPPSARGILLIQWNED